MIITQALATALGEIRGLFIFPMPKNLHEMKKLSYLCGAYNIYPILYLLAGNDNPYRNIDDCLAMGRVRETWRKYTAEMRCVVSNPVREAFVI